MENISIKHYINAIKFYLSGFLVLSLFMILLPIIDNSFWLLYLFIMGVLFIIILPFVIFGVIYLYKAKKALGNKLEIGRVVGFETGFSIIPVPRLALKLKTNDGRILITNSVLSSKQYEIIKKHEIQVAVNKKNKVYIIMAL